MTTEIKLTQGFVAIVDDIDADFAKHKWHAQSAKRGKPYAARGGGNHKVLLHREIIERMIGRSLLPVEVVDHIDRDQLNNTRANLRAVTQGQNVQNANLRSSSTTGFKGVSLVKHTGKYIANLKVSGKKLHLGCYQTAEEAAIAYNHAALKHYGELASFNEIANWQTASPIPVTRRGNKQANNRSGFPGVSPAGKKWRSVFQVNGKKTHLGVFDTPEEAYEAYCNANKALLNATNGNRS